MLAEQIYTKSGLKLEAQPSQKVFNLGGGYQIFKGVTNVDILPSADIVHDLNVYPWPIPDNTADLIFSSQCFEHLQDLQKVMKEVHRISKDGAHLVIDVPYFRHSGAFGNPDHRHFFTAKTMEHFYSKNKRVRGIEEKFKFELIDFWYGWPARSENPLKRAFKSYIRNHHYFYDEHLSILFPARIIVYELRIAKQ